MKRQVIHATTGRSTSREYIESALFKYLADFEYLEIGGESATAVFDRIYALRPIFDVDDVIDHAIDNGISIPQAISELEDELDSM